MGKEGRTQGGMILRPCLPADYGPVKSLLTQAFGRTDESDLVDRLQSENAVTSALVAEYEGEITGVVILSRLEAPFPALALAPLAVAPLWQAQGIGGLLIRAALGAAGGRAVFVLGAPEYYARFGFSAERAAGYVCAYAGPSFLVHGPDELPATGRILYPQAFQGL